jgi:hypothetical protein
MFYDERANAVRHLIHDHVRSPSLKHIRDAYAVGRLAQRIVDTIDRQPSVWTKWDGLRESVIRKAAGCWIPLDDLVAFFNSLPGPYLTDTDVEQRLNAIYEEPFERYPEERFREGCLALYEREIAKGTEMSAIIGELQEYLHVEEERQRLAWDEQRRIEREAEQQALEQRFLSGADCKWVSIQKSADIYCRKNGRAFRLSPTNDKRFKLFCIEERDDKGDLLGLYRTRGDATKALDKIAYEPEFRR